MKLLVSLCNKESAEGLAEPGVYLYAVDTEAGTREPVPTEHPDLMAANGMTGLCFHEGAVVGVRQRRPNQLVFLDPKTLAVEGVTSLETSMAGHSMVSRDGALYLVATGLDSLLRITPEGEAVVWQHGPGGTDSIHCNGLALHDGRLHVSGFGPKRGDLWSSAEDGFLRDVERDEIVRPGIYHPHTVSDVDGELWWCESSRMSVCNAAGQRLEVPEGYCRGLHVTADRLHVGTSTGRKKSESTGRIIEQNTETGRHAGACQVLVYERDPDDLAACKLLRAIDLSDVGSEIYDLLPLA
jgi:hypothetical protein